MKIDVIIPLYKPDNKFKKLLLMLKKQTVPINRIIIINTEQKYFDSFFYGSAFLEQFDNLFIKHISAYEFDHGLTRHKAVLMSDADYFVCMTDDAVPMDKFLIEKLVAHVANQDAQVAYARQCVGKRSSEIERYTRKFNYPDKSMFKTKNDLSKLGIKTYFCSNVCACYDRSVYDELGGFVRHTIFNEDMIYAAKLIKAGYTIYYCSEAKVVHSHKYTNMAQLRRNFDLGVSQAKFPEIFDAVPSEGEGKKLVKATSEHLKSVGKSNKIPGLYITSAYKYLGFLLGKHYKLIPKPIIMRITMNPNYWKKPDNEINIDPSYGCGRSKEEDSWNKPVKNGNGRVYFTNDN